MSEATNWVRVAAAADVGEGTATAVEIGSHSIAVYHLAGGAFHVMDNVCSHAFALLSDGWLEGHVIECPLHAGQFDVRTGKGLCAPIEEDLKVYEIKIENGGVFANLK